MTTILAFNEMVEALGKIVDAVELPIIADAEAGYGNAINTMFDGRYYGS